MSKSKKILYILPHLGKGGAEKVISDLAKYNSFRNDVQLLLFYNTKEDKYNISNLHSNIEVDYIFSKEISFMGFQRKMVVALFYILCPLFASLIYKKFRFKDFDIVHINLTLPAFYARKFVKYRDANRTKERYIYTFHNNLHLLKGISKYLNLYSWKFADKFVYELVEEDGKKLEKFVNKEKMAFIPFGHIGSEISSIDRSRVIQILNKVPKSHAIFLTISRVEFFFRKMDKLIKAMYFYKKHYDSKFTFVVAGDGSDMQRAKNLVSSYGLDDNVIFLGYVDNPEALCEYASIYLTASVCNMVGVAALQAASKSKPIVAIQTVDGREPLPGDDFYTHEDPLECANFLISLQDPVTYKNYKEKMSNFKIKNEELASDFFIKYDYLYNEQVSKSFKFIKI